MTAEELIRKLAKLDPDTEITVNGDPIHGLDEESKFLFVNNTNGEQAETLSAEDFTPGDTLSDYEVIAVADLVT